MVELYRSGGDMDNTSLGRCVLPDPVPAGKRLVIETVTGVYYQDGGLLGPAYMTIKGLRYGFPWVDCGRLTGKGEDRRFFGFNHYVRLYVDGPETLQFDAYGGASFGSGSDPSGSYTVTGYLEDLP